MNFIEEKILEKGSLDKLILRFPPENSGYAHIGHAKSICLNFGLAEKYNGKCNLRFDDTNPSNESNEFTESIKKDIEWLGFKPSKVTHTSDYFDFIYYSAIVLIKKGLAYVDDSTSEEIAELKGTPTIPGKESPYYSRTIDENLELFNKMKLGEFEEGSKTLRAKIDMSSSNMILRDPILYRIINKEHHHVGDKWKIYPMYDFAHPLSDYIEGITDSLCTLEFEAHYPLYLWVLNNCDLDKPLPEETEFSRLNIDYTIMSKRKLKILVEEGYVKSWNDPRMPTISGLRRRGYTPKSIKDFCETISITRRESVVSHLLLEECLRKDLNDTARRFMCVFDPIKVTITNFDSLEESLNIDGREIIFTKEIYIEREDFKLVPDNKYHRLKIDGEVRLKGAYVIKANDFIMEDGKIVEIFCTYDPSSKSGMVLDRKVKGTIHWVSAKYNINIPVNEYSNLFLESNPDESDNFLDSINKNSLVINNNAYFELGISDLKIGETVQMIRKGYYCLDEDGSINKTIGLKEGYKV